VAGAKERFGVKATGFFAASGLLAGELGCAAFRNQPPLLDSTDIDTTTAANNATLTISSEAIERFDLGDFEFFRKLRFFRINRERL
jgi:hypothetical protein